MVSLNYSALSLKIYMNENENNKLIEPIPLKYFIHCPSFTETLKPVHLVCHPYPELKY